MLIDFDEDDAYQQFVVKRCDKCHTDHAPVRECPEPGSIWVRIIEENPDGSVTDSWDPSEEEQ